MKQIQEIAVLHEDVSSGNSNLSYPSYMSCISKLTNPLSIQVLDLRSMNAKEAGLSIQVLAQ